MPGVSQGLSSTLRGPEEAEAGATPQAGTPRRSPHGSGGSGGAVVLPAPRSGSQMLPIPLRCGLSGYPESPAESGPRDARPTALHDQLIQLPLDCPSLDLEALQLLDRLDLCRTKRQHRTWDQWCQRLRSL